MRKIFLSFFLLFLPLLALGAEDTWKYKAYEAEFWNKLDDRFREAKLERVAVVPFNSSSDVPDPQQYQRRIESGLIQLSRCRYIVLTRDSEDIEELMRNFNFEMSDLFDQSTTARLGKALSAQVIVSGELFKKLNGEVRLYLHLVQAETGQIIYEELPCFDTKSERMLPIDRLHPMDSKTEMEQFRFWNSVDEALRSDGIERLAVLPRKKTGMTDTERQFEIRLVKLADYRYSVLCLLRQNLTTNKSFIAHDPDRLSRILKNLNMELSDLFNLYTVARVGKMLGTQALVLVKRTDSGVTVDILNVQTGRLIFRASGVRDEVGRYRWRRF